uniref:Uncharacterized protein n=1 Tax=Arundo donax TaxID=35708 RepID=A0A0A9CBS1_ARUDO
MDPPRPPSSCLAARSWTAISLVHLMIRGGALYSCSAKSLLAGELLWRMHSTVVRTEKSA